MYLFTELEVKKVGEALRDAQEELDAAAMDGAWVTTTGVESSLEEAIEIVESLELRETRDVIDSLTKNKGVK